MRTLPVQSLILAVAAMATFIVSCEGPTGPAGTSGTPGMSGLQTVSTETLVPSNTFASLKADCPADKKVISGGYAAVGDGSQFVHAWQSYPSAQNSWSVAVQNAYAGSVRVTAFALCATVE